MAYTFPGERVVMVFAIWLRMNLKESPVFERLTTATNRQQNLHLLVACSKQILLAGNRAAFWSGW